MRKVTVTLESISPYSQGRFHNTPKENKELHDTHEARTWREKLHVDKDGHVIIPPMVFKNCIADAAKYLSIQIPGKGKTTYTKHFEAGIMVIDPLVLQIKKEEVEGKWLHLPSDGRRGGNKRVMKCFPELPEWTGDVTYYVLDDTITADVFEYHLKQAGQFIGIGVFRPRNNGYFGRFKIVETKWENEE